jgi:hypothetical protein
MHLCSYGGATNTTILVYDSTYESITMHITLSKLVELSFVII